MINHFSKHLPTYIAMIVQVLVQVALLAYFGGQLTERVNTNQASIKEVKTLVYQVIQHDRASN